MKNITTTQQITEYVQLWNLMQQVILDDSKDEIVWTLNASGTYNTKSAYKAQFAGVAGTFETTNLRNAQVEPKVCMFTWIAMHEKALTTDNLEAKGRDNNVICPLCLEVRKQITTC